jgi:hypothetical protein
VTTAEWRELQSEELRDLYSSSSIIRLTRPRRMRRGKYGGNQKFIPKFWWLNLKERDHLQELGVDTGII